MIISAFHNSLITQSPAIDQNGEHVLSEVYKRNLYKSHFKTNEEELLLDSSWTKYSHNILRLKSQSGRSERDQNNEPLKQQFLYK